MLVILGKFKGASKSHQNNITLDTRLAKKHSYSAIRAIYHAPLGNLVTTTHNYHNEFTLDTRMAKYKKHCASYLMQI